MQFKSVLFKDQLYLISYTQRGLFMGRQWTPWKVNLGEEVCRGLKICGRAGGGDPCPANLPEVVLAH